MLIVSFNGMLVNKDLKLKLAIYNELSCDDDQLDRGVVGSQGIVIETMHNVPLTRVTEVFWLR